MEMDKFGLISDIEISTLAGDFAKVEEVEPVLSAAGAAVAPLGSAAGAAAGAL